jgi:hypothetical protein
MKKRFNNVIPLILFSIAMAALESAVVVYLRALYYPSGFTVAFKLIETRILLVELAREAATIVMLICIAYVAGKNFRERLAFFLLSFAVWDIFYYGWLKLFINWPSTILEWDILFLIPFTWLAPVIAPIICSVFMLLLAYVLLVKPDNVLTSQFWMWLISGCAFVLFTFMQDYGGIIFKYGFLGDYFNLLHNPAFLKISAGYVPDSFNWPMFCLGISAVLIAIYRAHSDNSHEGTKALRSKPMHTRLPL